MNSRTNTAARYLVLLSLVLPHPSFAMKPSGTEEIKQDLESQVATSSTNQATTTQTLVLERPLPNGENLSQLRVVDQVRAILRHVPGFSDGVSSLGSQSSRTEHTLEAQDIYNDPDVDQTNAYIGFSPNQGGIPGNTLNLGGGMAGLEQPRDHFTANLHADKDRYFERIYCLLDVGEGWLSLFQQMSTMGASALGLYLTANNLYCSNHELPQVVLGLNIGTLLLSGMIYFSQSRKSALKDKGYGK